MAKVISKGICNFCKNEFAKNTMTQHLKHCKQRAATIVDGAESSTEAEQSKLFHIVVEGRYNPQYWIHLEVPVSDTMADLDWFLRNIWLEHFDHLSAFKVGTTNYSRPDNFFCFESNQQEDADEDENDQEEVQEDNVNEVEALLDGLPSYYSDYLSPDMLSELKKFQSVDELLDFLRKESEEAKNAIQFNNFSYTPEQRKAFVLESILQCLIQELDDRDMDTPLAKALKVGQKFSYEYDFGSTTHLKLRVVTEHDGVIRDKKDTITLLARNVPPGISCCVCGKPATRVACGYYSAEDDGYCSSRCAKKNGKDYEEMMSVINSPRVGVV